MAPNIQKNLFEDGVAPISTRRKTKGQPSVSQGGRAPAETELASYLERTSSQLIPDSTRLTLLGESAAGFPWLFFKGDASLLNEKLVSIVGTRNPSSAGVDNAGRVAKLLVELGYGVLSGLAKGIDAVAHRKTIEFGGKTVAVMGTPIHKIYPAENKNLAEQIASQGLLMSPSLPHEETGQYLFPRRNRLMALLSKATIIIEAGPTSGVVHQAAECLRQGRTLILLKPLVDNQSLPWVAGFLKSGAKVAEKLSDIRRLLE